MTSSFKNPTLLGAYLIFGALIGVFAIYPLTMIIVWLEFAAERLGGPSLQEFIGNRFWLGFIPKLLHIELAASFAFLGGLLGVSFGIFTRKYVSHLRELRFYEQEKKRTIPEIIKGGESGRVEFKSSVRWDIQEQRTNRTLEKVIAKTLAGFLNAGGGDLVIGVADDGEILGLEADYATLRHSNADGFERLITDLVKKTLGGDLCPLLHFAFTEINGKEICLVTAEKASRPVYVADGNNSAFFVRAGNSTRQLDVKEALDYAAERWSK